MLEDEKEYSLVLQLPVPGGRKRDGGAELQLVLRLVAAEVWQRAALAAAVFECFHKLYSAASTARLRYARASGWVKLNAPAAAGHAEHLRASLGKVCKLPTECARAILHPDHGTRHATQAGII